MTEDLKLPIIRYTRFGECRRCGACCIEDGCDHLVVANGGATCAVYDTRPEYCRVWPAAPPILFRTCGFRFRDVWEGRDLEPREI